MALKYPDILQSNNPNAYGIVPATEVSGHKQVANLTALYALADPILSLSGNNTDNDAVGQIWYVASEGKHYQLVDWANRDKESGWVVYGGFKDGDTDFFANGIVTEISNSQDEDSFSLHVISSTRNADGTWVEGDDQTIEIPTATDEKAGVMSSADKAKLDNLKPATLGQGYGTCTTGTTTAAKVVTLSSYELVTGGIVSVKFDNAVGASATMNINGKGAKPIYYRGSAIVTGVIGAGDVTTFIYDGSKYIYLGTDNALSRAGGKINGELVIADDTDDVVEIDAQGITLRDTSDDEQPQTKITHAKVESNVIKKTGGTSDQVLMADGSVAGTITTAWLEANLT